MYRAVNVDGGSARVARIEGIDHLRQDRYRAESAWRGPQYFHVFRSAQQSENRRVGLCRKRPLGRYRAAPIASLLTELYLTDTVTRPRWSNMSKTCKSIIPTMENDLNPRLSVGRVDWWSTCYADWFWRAG